MNRVQVLLPEGNRSGKEGSNGQRGGTGVFQGQGAGDDAALCENSIQCVGFQSADRILQVKDDGISFVRAFSIGGGKAWKRWLSRKDFEGLHPQFHNLVATAVPDPDGRNAVPAGPADRQLHRQHRNGKVKGRERPIILRMELQGISWKTGAPVKMKEATLFILVHDIAGPASAEGPGTGGGIDFNGHGKPS